MKKPQKLPIINLIYSIFLLALPPLLYFSYRPLISLGGNETMNFELSLPLLWLVFFDLFAFILLLKTRPPLKVSKIWPWLLFPIFATLSIAWSFNPLRGALTVGILWLIYFAVFSFFALRKTVPLPKNFPRLFWIVFFASTLVICVWCWIQSVLDLSGLPQPITLMCDGCISIMFGPPRPDGFAIEPQFMGNLLLAPALLSAWFVFSPNPDARVLDLKKTHRQAKSSRKYGLYIDIYLYPILRYLAFCFIVATLFLTLSRGAIYAFFIGLALLTVLKICHEKSPRFLLSWLFVALSFAFTLNAQGIMADRGPTSDTYEISIAKVIHQLSLGLIDFRDSVTPQPDDSASEIVTTPEATSIAPEFSTESASKKPAPVFDGYIESSTNARLNLTTSAFYIWQTSPKNLLVGVGLGGAGQALYDFGESPAPKEIVQNQYASLLLETGLIGSLLALFTLFLILRVLRKSPLRAPLLSLLVAYAVTLCFFSGLPNALQIYLLPPLFLFAGSLPAKKV